ncbi:MAG: SMP-30/gluconolactonase/LRE family protein [Rhodanobacteraceae bacterium]
MKMKRLLCCLALMLLSATAFAQVPGGEKPVAGAPDPSTLSEAQIKGVTVPQVLDRLASAYRANGDVQRLTWSLQRLTDLLPNSGEAKLALATLYAAQDEKSKTYDLLLRMQQQGFGYDLSHDARFDKVADTKVWAYVVANLKANLKPFGEGKVAFSLPTGDTLLESLVWDPKRQQFLVGSVRDGTIQRVDKSGKLVEFIKPDANNGLWSVYAMAAAPARDRLYVASTASVYFKGFKQDDYGKAGLFEFNLSTGKFLQKMLLPADGKPHTLSSLAVGKDGAAFVADGIRNEIYRVDGGKLKLLVANPRLTSVRGLAVSDDGHFLYFADYALGIFGVDLRKGTGFDLNYDPASLVLGGIDGLYWYQNNLIAIENGMSPPRVMRLTLSANGHDIAKVMPLDAANPNFSLPTYGAIDGDSLYFIANSQRNHYDKYGDPKDVSKLQPIHVFRSNLRFAWNKDGVGTKVSPIPVATPSAGKKLLEQKTGAKPANKDDGHGPDD